MPGTLRSSKILIVFASILLFVAGVNSNFVKSSCSVTLHPDLCYSTLSGVSEKVNTPKDFIGLAVNKTKEIVQQNYFTIKKLTHRTNLTKRETIALHDCLEMVADTLQELNQVIFLLDEYPAKKGIRRYVDDILTLMSTTLTNQETCVDGFSHDKHDRQVRESLIGGEINAGRMCSNSLAMIKNMTDTDMASEVKINGRKLKEDWPEWLSAGDRRLFQSGTVTPNVVVAADGSGDFTTVSAAVAAAPNRSTTRYVIRIAAGVYRENVDIPSNKLNLMFLGDGRTSTIITASRSVVGGSTTFNSATVGNTTPVTHKAYAITNIKTYVPLILDLTTRNYDPWSDLFTAHCRAYDVLDHIDSTYDSPKSPPTDPEWTKLDGMVKLWLFGTISQSLIPSAYSSQATARKVWLNLNSIFCDNNESTTMQLESELRTISMGDLSVHDYCNKIKKLADLLEGLGEKVKEKHVVIHAVNGLSSKYDNIAGIIRHQKPFPTFSEMRSMLTAEEQRLSTIRVPTVSHDSHSSSPTLLHAGQQNQNRGGGNNSYRRNDYRGGRRNDSRSGERRRQPSSTVAGGSTGNPPYGWVYIPPPPNLSPNNSPWTAPNQRPYWAGPTPHVQQPNQWPKHSSSNNGLLGNRPPQAQQQHQAHFQSTSTNQPPWAWLGNADQPTSLPEMFNTMNFNDPGNSGWVMDTGATDHVHANADSSPPNPM